MTDKLSPAETTADNRLGYTAALHAKSGARPAPDKIQAARNIVDMLLNDGCDENDVAIIATLMRGDVFSRAAAARRIERLTTEQPGAGKMGLGIPDTDRVVPRFTETDRS